ncbi:hypothetical protein ABZ383_22625 [Streptomyces sp. NPDC005900]|uniref:hypothetical protein n=1 Tax=Streptomyces sp. NPDC005900 TaxID=3154569 RepID=UPI00340B5CD3
MSVRDLSSADVLREDAQASALRDLLSLEPGDVVDLAAQFVVGDPLVTVAAAMLGEQYIDRYAAGKVLGVLPS